MSQQQFESSIKIINYSQECVFGKLSDLNNLSVIQERMEDPAFRSAIKTQVPEDKMEQIAERVREMKFDTDSVSCNVSPLGEVSLRIIDRDHPKCIKFETANSPIPLNLWIQLLPVSESQCKSQCKMKLTVRADLNPFIKAMVSKPLKEGVEKLADMLAMIPYGA